MFETVKKLIAEGLGIEESKITPDATFAEDLGADSLDLFELAMSLEDEFDIKIPSEDLENMNTVSDVVNYVEEHK